MQWWQWWQSVAVVFSDFPPSLSIGCTGQQEAGTTGLQAQFHMSRCPVPERMLAGYPRFPERHFKHPCALPCALQMWVLRLKFQWHKRHRLSVQDSCSTASPNSAEHFSSRIVAYRSMAEESQQLLFETDSEPGLQATPRPEELQHTLFSWTRQNIIDSQVLARTAECSHSFWLALFYICEDQCHVKINRN